MKQMAARKVGESVIYICFDHLILRCREGFVCISFQFISIPVSIDKKKYSVKLLLVTSLFVNDSLKFERSYLLIKGSDIVFTYPIVS